MAETSKRKKGEGAGRPTIYTDRKLLQILKELAKELGRAPQTGDLQERNDLPCLMTYMRRFGSWKNVLEMAGFSPSAFKRQYSDEQLIKILKATAKELGRAPQTGDLQERNDLPCLMTYMRRFGSWKQALEAAGFPLDSYRLRYNDEQMIIALKKFTKELGYIPTSREINAKEGIPSYLSYKKRFGTWDKALEMAGLTPNGDRRKKKKA